MFPTVFSLIRRRARMLGVLASMAACMVVLPAFAADAQPFVPPKARTLPEAERPWPVNSFVTVAYHDVQDGEADARYLAVRTDRLVAHFAWLRQNGYQPVSVDQILAARDGGKPLPAKAVLLTFDDGYRSFYDRVFPLLKATGWPAVLAPVGEWLDAPADQPVDFGGLQTPRERFATWAQVGEMAASGLVEVGAHTDHLHHGIVANPQGNTQPAAATRRYDPATASYENDEAFLRRLEADVAAITTKIRDVTGKAPRVWVWPYGAANGSALAVVKRHGYQMAMTLDEGIGSTASLFNTPRVLVTGDPSVDQFASAVIATQEHRVLRVAHVDLDYLYDADPAQQARNFDHLVQRVQDLGVNTVFLQAFSDAQGDGTVHSVYFPNRWLPVRADLFNRVAWQLRTRTRVAVYAWMPVLAFDLDAALPRVQRVNDKGEATPDTGQYRRMSPFDPTVRSRIADLYEDLARSAWFDGVLFHDDALLSDFEDASAPALAAYRAAGLPGTIAELRADPATLRRWTQFKTRALTDFTLELAGRVRAIRGPQVKTARNIFAMPMLKPESEAWFAQNLDDFLASYDWTAPMAMPFMENVPDADADAWLDTVVDSIRRRPGAMDRTVFELQAVDWRNSQPVPGQRLAGWMRRLQMRGARSFGYYPDNFITGVPSVEQVRPALSNSGALQP
ncbi:poly-beta-1,6-N-acetyl-D-glucosamine N-deacetylase PgaB [Acidovorax sp. NPDC077693]|uniref:poly-beta-1,6-N-acetyl-D-glucosamine N-deacetylase PgaB n=1 Tax=unclassified Acidovorax TaxID=2684926 RepID=UPI0037C70563